MYRTRYHRADGLPVYPHSSGKLHLQESARGHVGLLLPQCKACATKDIPLVKTLGAAVLFHLEAKGCGRRCIRNFTDPTLRFLAAARQRKDEDNCMPLFPSPPDPVVASLTPDVTGTSNLGAAFCRHGQCQRGYHPNVRLRRNTSYAESVVHAIVGLLPPSFRTRLEASYQDQGLVIQR